MTSVRTFALAGTLALSSLGAQAQAATFSVNFCPGNTSCPTGIIEASLTVIERLDTPDVNDYFVDLKLVGTAQAPDVVDIVSFKIDSLLTTGDYEALPTLTSAPSGVNTWSTYFDNVSGSQSACTSNTGQQQSVCSNAAGNGVTVAGRTLQWRYEVDLAASRTLGSGSMVNFRAAFFDAQQVRKKVNGQWKWVTEYKNAGILSPNGGALVCVAGCPPPGGDRPIPEPTTLALLGAGLLGAGVARRRR